MNKAIRILLFIAGSVLLFTLSIFIFQVLIRAMDVNFTQSTFALLTFAVVVACFGAAVEMHERRY